MGGTEDKKKVGAPNFLPFCLPIVSLSPSLLSGMPEKRQNTFIRSLNYDILFKLGRGLHAKGISGTLEHCGEFKMADCLHLLQEVTEPGQSWWAVMGCCATCACSGLYQALILGLTTMQQLGHFFYFYGFFSVTLQFFSYVIL